MRTPQDTQPERRTPTRRPVTTAIVAAVLAATAVTFAPAPADAEAAIPAVAQNWTTLMRRSLTVTAVGAQLRQTLAAQRTASATRAAEVAKANAALTAAQQDVTAATAADTDAKVRVAASTRAVMTAKKNLTKVNPRNKAAVARARNAITAAKGTLTLRTSEAQDRATALTTAQSAVTAAGESLTKANAAAEATADAVVATQGQIALLQTPASLAAQAAATSRTVVDAVRPGFTTADTVTVYGTTVHRTVAFAYQRMVDDAKKSGIAISGGGFRTQQRQIELRKINGCPDVWTAPSSSCRVPTAIPGRSLHEIGMAIDITSGGRSLSSSSPAFKWLKIHAAEYGFKNLPSEPWHWSITGS